MTLHFPDQPVGESLYAYKDSTKFGNQAWCQEGDWVCIGRYAGARFRDKDEKELRIINDDEVIAGILNPEDVNSV